MIKRATSGIARIPRVVKRRGRFLVRPSGWVWGARWAALTLRWHAGRPVTIRHYHDFGKDHQLVGHELDGPEDWDALRTATDGQFALPATRGEWEREADRWQEGPVRARAIDSWLRARRVGSLASYGVGSGSLELWLHRLSPERPLAITEYAPATVAWLGRVFPEAEVHHHNLLTDGPLDAEVHLFSRIGPGFSTEEWRSILQRFSDRRILFAAGGIELKLLRIELRKRYTDPNPTFAGFSRNRPALEALWEPTHRSQFLSFGDLDAWALEPRVD